MAVPKAEELVATPYRHGSKEKAETFFLDGMTAAMHNLAEQAHSAFPVTIYYAFKQAETKGDAGTSSTGWETFLAAVLKAGFALTGTWPMRTELSNRMIGSGTNALASSIVLVCHKRAEDAPSISRREFIRELNAVLPVALDEMTRGGINSPVAPVDLSQAIIGPGMAIFSKYTAVLEADGTPMTVRTALQLINRFLAEDDFDHDTQFCLHWFETQGWATGIQALWKPVGTEEAFEIVRRRLFSSISDKAAMEAVCREFADFYIENASSFPHETQESRYYERLIHAYPIHPEVFDRLYDDWSSLDNFQRTRGVLKLMAQVIHRLWRDGSKDALLMPGSLPLYDPQTRNEVIYYLPQGWDPVLDKDVDGERAETTRLESTDTRFGSVHACRRVARTIFLGSAPSTSKQMVRGVAQERVLLGAVQPGQSVGTFKDALRRLLDKTQYFYTGNDRYWLDTRPGLRREMEDRRRRFNDRDDVFPMIRERLRESFSTNLFLIHPFTPSMDISDDWSLRLVLLTPEAPYSRSGLSLAQEKAAEILRYRGEQPRQRQNRLIFLAADFDALSRLKDQVRSCLAWQSIVNDIKDMHLNLDQFQSREATQGLEAARDALKRMIRETYKWLLTPVQEAKVGGGLSELIWETFQVSASTPNWSQEIEKVLTENELLISNWSPIHLHRYLKEWFWKSGVDEVKALDFWQKSCQYLYLPRLRDDMVYRNTLAAGAGSEDFFGIAYGKEDGKYKGFTLGAATTPILDEALLLIEPSVARAYAEAERVAKAAASQPQPVPPVVGEGAPVAPSGAGVGAVAQPAPAPVTTKVEKRRFYATVNIEPVGAKLAFANIVEEVLQQFTAKPGVKVSISVEIEAESPAAFDEALQRAVKENCDVLKFSSAEFES